MPLRSSSGPVYRRIADDLRERIGRGEWASGAKLPSETALGEQYGAHRLTVRRAIEDLTRLGLLHVRHGAGTFVAPPALRYEISVDDPARHATAEGVERTYTSLGIEAAEELLRITAEDDTEARRHLELRRAGMLRIETLLYVGGEPCVVSSTYVENRRFPGLADRWDGQRSVYDVLRENYGAGLVYAWRSFGATAADADDAAAMAIPPGSPILLREGLSLDLDGRPTAYVRRRCRGDRMKFVLRYRD
ncbi:GntR family transcriptional regulator [Streptomycetaceae bacterium NBC_01309]